ncbi:MAG: hypothetical protein DWC09_07115 [Candidatus Poseidoniales archaeon]|nr:MAG: hypothetical protein DWC09_07115 [Candidatus Poseidoniales archaeon]
MYIGTIALGLWFSATSCNGLLADEYAEWPVNIWCWGLFAWYYRSGERKQRIEMLTVVAFATPMELFFSEVWLIYEYQRDLMPLFVPAGHYFLFDLGRIFADKLKENLALPVLLPLVPIVFYGAWTGGDTSAVFLLALVLVFIRLGPQPRLYAAMVWAALAMEIVGTSLGNWTWASEVPWTGLTAWNPPLLVGSFYCLGDVLVNLAVVKFEGKDRLEVNA